VSEFSLFQIRFLSPSLGFLPHNEAALSCCLVCVQAVLLTVVSGEKVMLLLDSRKDGGGGRRKVCRCLELPRLVREEEED